MPVHPGRPHRLRPGRRGADAGSTIATRASTRWCTWRRSPGPGMAPNAATFANNVIATYNVFSAARLAGIRNVVWASSETLLGLPFDIPPPYVPSTRSIRPGRRPRTRWPSASTSRWPRQFCRWDPRAEDDRAAVLQRDGAGRLRRASRPSTPIRCCASGTCGRYIDARDGAQAVRLALEHQAHRPGHLHHRQRRHRDVPNAA